MSQNAKKLSVDPIARKKIAVLRLAGFSCKKIAKETGRHERTIIKEIRRPEHKRLIRSCVAAFGKKRLPAEVWAEVEKALNAKISA